MRPSHRSIPIRLSLLTLGAALGCTGVTVVETPPTEIEVLQSPATALAGVPAADSVVVRVVNEHGNATPDVTVSFSAGSGEVRPSEVVTRESGVARVLWIPGPEEGPQELVVEVPGVTRRIETSVTAAEPGSTRLGRGGYVEYRAGGLPLILSAPHGGTLEPGEVPDRFGGTQVRDFATDDLARRLADEIETLTGERPHLVLSLLHRRKLDPNREIDEATEGHPLAEHAWLEFHGFLEHARARVVEAHGSGLVLDLHGHGHDIQRIELGYLLSAAELALDGAALEGLASSSSVRELAGRTGSLADLLHGPAGLGQLLVDGGYPSVPSADDPAPGEAPYFTGGYITARYGSRNRADVDAIQLEHNRDGIRDSAAERQAYAEAAASAIVAFLESRYGLAGG